MSGRTSRSARLKPTGWRRCAQTVPRARRPLRLQALWFLVVVLATGLLFGFATNTYLNRLIGDQREFYEGALDTPRWSELEIHHLTEANTVEQTRGFYLAKSESLLVVNSKNGVVGIPKRQITFVRSFLPPEEDGSAAEAGNPIRKAPREVG